MVRCRRFTDTAGWVKRAARLLALIAALVGGLTISPALVAADDAASTGPSAPVPVEINGKVVAVRGDQLGVLEAGAEQPVAFTFRPETRIERGGERVAASELHPGDTIRMTIDGRSGTIDIVRAAPQSDPFGAAGTATWLVPLVVVTAAITFARVCRRPTLPAPPATRRRQSPFTVLGGSPMIRSGSH